MLAWYRIIWVIKQTDHARPHVLMYRGCPLGSGGESRTGVRCYFGERLLGIVGTIGRATSEGRATSSIDARYGSSHA